MKLLPFFYVNTKKHLARLLCAWCIILFPATLQAAPSTPQESDMTYRYWDLGASQKRDHYQFALLQLVLDKTTPDYGPYNLNQVLEKYTSSRSTRELIRGETINITCFPSPTWEIKSTDANRAITIKKPLLRGLLGYRKLVVRREDLDKFEKITTQNELKNLLAGQGRDWEDINIYQFNGYKVVDNADYFNLFAMLAAGRFDYIPLSVIEIDDIMEHFPKYSKDFVVVPNIIIYYPFPVLFNVSGRFPKLAERVSKGLDMASEDGSFSKMFELFFSDELQKIKSENVKVFILKSPSIPETLGLSKPLLLNEYTIIQ